MTAASPTEAELMQAVTQLNLSTRKSLPWALGAAILTIAAFAFAVWTVWTMQSEIRNLRSQVAQSAGYIAASDRRNLALTGTLRTIYARPGLEETTRNLVREALGYARANEAQLAQATASVAATASAVEQIGTSQPLAASPPQSTRVVSAGTTDGWDIDIFWCDSSTDPAAAGRNRERADAAAGRLAAHTGWAAGMTLGRVRVRPLPERLQGGGFPTAGSGMVIRPEENAAERNAAQAILAVVNTTDDAYVLGRSRQPTRWYISMFVCR